MFYLPGLLIGKTKDITPVDCGGASRAWARAGAGIGGDESTVETEPRFGLRGAEVWKKKSWKSKITLVQYLKTKNKWEMIIS